MKKYFQLSRTTKSKKILLRNEAVLFVDDSTETFDISSSFPGFLLLLISKSYLCEGVCETFLWNNTLCVCSVLDIFSGSDSTWSCIKYVNFNRYCFFIFIYKTTGEKYLKKMTMKKTYSFLLFDFEIERRRSNWFLFAIVSSSS